MASRSKTHNTKAPKQDLERLVKSIEPFARQVAALQEQARSLGIFTNDRELLICEACGLREDVAIEGRLFTHFGAALANDTGMRFAETATQGTFCCPGCGGEVVEPAEEP